MTQGMHRSINRTHPPIDFLPRPFHQPQEDDGSLKVDMILARRRLQTGQATAAAHHHEKDKHHHPEPAEQQGKGGKGSKGGVKKALPLLALKDPRREKYCYEYHVKFKNLSYVKTKWLTYHQIGACVVTRLRGLGWCLGLVGRFDYRVCFWRGWTDGRPAGRTDGRADGLTCASSINHEPNPNPQRPSACGASRR